MHRRKIIPPLKTKSNSEKQCGLIHKYNENVDKKVAKNFPVRKNYF